MFNLSLRARLSSRPGYRFASTLRSSAFVAAAVIASTVISPSASADRSGNSNSNVIARTNSGSVRGQISSQGAVIEFKGIPYAAPPVGQLRWKPPRDPAHWKGVRDALESQSPCPQSGTYGYPSTNEDCLYLNVTVPNVRHPHKLPVMVFIHGGGQTASAMNDYNADRLVTRGKPVIYVAMNYRLNIFAFFAHKALSAEAPKLGSGNYATLDQQKALMWVRSNIANFGGDPKNVTVFGESGGGQAVCILMASPPAAGLFQRAISESGPCQWQLYQSLTSQEKAGADVAASLGCNGTDPLACLRALPASAILAKQSSISNQPAWGGGAFPLPMRESMATGQFNRVPLIQGSNRDEALWQLTTQYVGAGKPLTAAQYPEVLKTMFGASRVDAILEKYPLSRYPTPLYALSAVESDSSMPGQRIGLCNLHLANQIVSPHTPVYAYEFADPTAPYPGVFTAPFLLGGAAHTKELSYLFDQTRLTSTQKVISDAMIRYWTNFAYKGDPNGRGLPAWPVYKPAQPNVIQFKSHRIEADTLFSDRHNCKFWAEQGFDVLSGPYPTPTSLGPVYQ
jgi:para-nitrobenzyl esterase